MPATYSISVGLPTEAFRKKDITSVLLDLPDNTQKLISPKDVRDAFLSTWANAAFKQTIGLSSIEYIGIDSGNPTNRDIKQKIFIGKRSYAGLDIMNSNLLSPANLTDIYFFNTKPDTITQSQTRISILAGTNSTLYENAPYIESKLSSSSLALDLNLVNPSVNSGPINIYSYTGRVSINGITFPTAAETSASASNGRILKYSGSFPNGALKWADPTISISSIGSPGQPLYIYGSPSFVNGAQTLEFVDPNAVTQTIGGIELGMSFSSFSWLNPSTLLYQNWPIVEVLRKLLYPYVPPTVSFTGYNMVTGTNYIEVGVTSSLFFTYSVTKYSEDIDNYQIVGPTNSIPYTTGVIGTYSGMSFSGLPSYNQTGTFSHNAVRIYQLPNYFTPTTVDYLLQVSDSGYGFFTHSATASFTYITPFYTSFLYTAPMVAVWPFFSTVPDPNRLRNILINSNTSKYVVPYPGPSQSVKFPYNGFGYLWFIYPASYPDLTMIKDPNGFVLHDADYLTASTFTYSLPTTPSTLGLPTAPYGQGAFKVYKSIGTCSYYGLGDFEFIF